MAASLGQKTKQSFFRMQAQVKIEFAFRALAASGYEVTLEYAYDLFAEAAMMEEITTRLKDAGTAEAASLLKHYHQSLLTQPAEQLAGVKSTLQLPEVFHRPRHR